MTDQTAQITLTIDGGPDADAEELEELGRNLREWLLELDVEEVAFASAGEPPEGAKSGGPLAWETILVTLAASGGILTTLINAIQGWHASNRQSKVSIQIGDDKFEATGMSAEQKQQLLDIFLKKHGGAVEADGK